MKSSFAGSRRHCGPQDQVVFNHTLVKVHDINDFLAENLGLDLNSLMVAESSDLRRENCSSKLDLWAALECSSLPDDSSWQNSDALADSLGFYQHHVAANLVRHKLIHYCRASWRQNHMQAWQVSHLIDSQRRAKSFEFPSQCPDSST